MTYVIGIDPGLRNLGLAILNLETKMGMMYVIDIITWDGDEHEVGADDYGILLLKLVEDYKIFFEKASCCFIERQPVCFKKNESLNIIKIQCYIEQTIRAKYPNCNVVLVDPKSVITYLGMKSTGKKGHAENKKNRSRLLKNILSPSNMALAKTKFKKGKDYHGDGIEAMQNCVFGVSKKRVFSKYTPGTFKHLKLDCKITDPHEESLKVKGTTQKNK